MRILVAEDEHDLNEIIVKKLVEEGYSVDACYDGAEAIDILSYTEYDAILLDIMMPKADGFQVLTALRSSRKETPVLFLSAHGKSTNILTVGDMYSGRRMREKTIHPYENHIMVCGSADTYGEPDVWCSIVCQPSGHAEDRS